MSAARWMVLVGVGIVLAPGVRAEIAVVRNVDGPRMIVSGTFGDLHVGEVVEMAVVPRRPHGVSTAIVADVDPADHRIALVLVRPGSPARMSERRGSIRIDNDRRLPLRPENALIVDRGEMIDIVSSYRYVANPPRFSLPRVRSRSVPKRNDIVLPSLPQATTKRSD